MELQHLDSLCNPAREVVRGARFLKDGTLRKVKRIPLKKGRTFALGNVGDIKVHSSSARVPYHLCRLRIKGGRAVYEAPEYERAARNKFRLFMIYRRPAVPPTKIKIEPNHAAASHTRLLTHLTPTADGKAEVLSPKRERSESQRRGASIGLKSSKKVKRARSENGSAGRCNGAKDIVESQRADPLEGHDVRPEDHKILHCLSCAAA